ncbi:MAG: CHAT domain-containing protein [Candidatus Aminicenantes bacterium]
MNGHLKSILTGVILFILAGLNVFPEKTSFNSQYTDGIYFQKTGEYEKAIDSFTSALGSGDTVPLKIRCLNKLGVLFWNTGDIQKAEEAYKSAFDYSVKSSRIKDSNKFKYLLEIIENYNNGKTARQNKDQIKSIKYFTKAAFISQKLNSREHQLKCLRQLSISYWYIDKFNIFYNLNKRCLDLSNDLNHSKEKSKSLNNLGAYYDLNENYSLALAKYFDALKIAEKNNFIEEKSSSYLNISTIYLHLGAYERSYEYLWKAYDIDKDSGNEEFIAQDLNNLGLLKKHLYMKKENTRYFIDSLHHFFEGLELAEKNELRALEIKIINNLGNLFLDAGEFNKAILYFQKGLDKRNSDTNSRFEAMLLVNIGFSYLELKRPDDALKNFHDALSVCEKTGSLYILWEVYYGIGRYYEELKKINEAVHWYEKSINAIDEIKKNIFLDVHLAGYISDKIKVYERLLNIYFTLHQKHGTEFYINKMFSLAEIAKANALMETLDISRTNIFDKVSPQLRESKINIEKEISSILKILYENNLSRNQRENLLQRFERLEEENLILLSKIGSQNPAIAQMAAFGTISLDDVQEFLKKNNSLMAEYFLGDKVSFVFFVSPAEKAVFSIPSRESLEKNLHGTLKLLSTPAYDSSFAIKSFRKTTQEIFPFLSKLKTGSDNLIIIPDGILYFFPFEVLMDVRSSDYLIDKYAVSYMPSSYSLLFLNWAKSRKNDSNLLFFGSPDYSQFKKSKRSGSADILLRLYEEEGYSFSSLPYSKEEVEEISKLFPSGKTEIYLGSKASEGHIKNLPVSDFNIIHFACHGFVNNDPFRSALVLSPEKDSGEDGFLQVREIYSLGFDADLVVLSACQTGKGLITKGEGLLGISRVFFYSGSRSVLSTLWNINDKSTVLFMTYFYGFLIEGMSKSEALRKAKLKLREKYENPFYWAPYILNGDFRGMLDFQ